MCVLVFDSCLAQFPGLRFLVPTTKGTYPLSEVGVRLDESILKSHRCMLSKSGTCVMNCCYIRIKTLFHCCHSCLGRNGADYPRTKGIIGQKSDARVILTGIFLVCSLLISKRAV